MEQVIGDKKAIILQSEDIDKAKILWKNSPNLAEESFADYYFDKKALQNKIFAVMQNSQVVSMLHMSPYAVAVRRNNISAFKEGRELGMIDMVKANASCLFGMTTRMDYKHLGLPDEVMFEALSYQRQEMRAFTYHIPNTQQELETYEQFGFAPVAGRGQYLRNENILSDELLQACRMNRLVEVPGTDYSISQADSSEYVTLAHFVDEQLSRQYGVFVIRNAVYYENLDQELKAHAGGIYLMKESGRIIGYFTMEYQEETTIYREVVFERDSILCKFFQRMEADALPAMARIVNLRNMVKYVCSEGKVTLAVQLYDPMIRENNGIFLWYLDENGSRMERVEDENNQNKKEPLPRPELSVTIGEFTSFLFGYRKIKNSRKMDSIHLLGPAWLTELN